MAQLTDLMTPAAIIDRDVVIANCERMLARAQSAGVALRPHVKTAKSADIAYLAHGGEIGPITVSTLGEIAYFAEAGFHDMTYAVGIDPAKVPTLVALKRRYDLTLSIIADSVRAMSEAGAQAAGCDATLGVLIEIDCGAGRAGVDPESDDLLQLARAATEKPGLDLLGVLTHAGHSYHAETHRELTAIATREADAARRATERLQRAGFAVPVVSIGSTPTALQAVPLDGITEIRPGVFVFFDLTQRALGVCETHDIALSVLATVIGHNRRAGHVLIDAGGLALSKDRGAEDRDERTGYGLVAQIDGQTLTGAHVTDVHQEHGMVVDASESDDLFARMPIGSRWRILPNHACMTAAPYDRYNIVRGADPTLVGEWSKARGW